MYNLLHGSVAKVYPNLVFLLMYPEGLLCCIVLYCVKIMMSKEDNNSEPIQTSAFDLIFNGSGKFLERWLGYNVVKVVYALDESMY